MDLISVRGGVEILVWNGEITLLVTCNFSFSYNVFLTSSALVFLSVNEFTFKQNTSLKPYHCFATVMCIWVEVALHIGMPESKYTPSGNIGIHNNMCRSLPISLCTRLETILTYRSMRSFEQHLRTCAQRNLSLDCLLLIDKNSEVQIRTGIRLFSSQFLSYF